MSKDYVIITTLSHFKLQYAIPADEFDKLGFDEPINQDELSKYLAAGTVKEFSQKHLGEVVSDVSVYDEELLIKEFDSTNSYLSDWTHKQKVEWINAWREDV